MKQLTIILLSILMLVSCSKDSDGFIRYEVKAGHLSPIQKYSRIDDPFPVSVNRDNMSFEFKVNYTWVMGYTGGWNKVGGFSVNNHKKNSCRIVTRCEDGYIIMGMYVYADGVRHEKRMDTVDSGTYTVLIELDDVWRMTFNGKTYELPAGKEKGINYRLFPNLRSEIDHDWVVPIKWD